MEIQLCEEEILNLREGKNFSMRGFLTNGQFMFECMMYIYESLLAAFRLSILREAKGLSQQDALVL